MHSNEHLKHLIYSTLLVFSMMLVAGCAQRSPESVDQSSSTMAWNAKTKMHFPAKPSKADPA